MGSNQLENIGILYDTTQVGKSKKPVDLKKMFGDFISTSDVLQTVKNDLSGTQLLNKAREKLTTPWILWLRVSEKPNIDTLLNVSLSDECCYEAVVKSQQDFYNSTHLEVRLFHKNHSLEFNGAVYPSVTPLAIQRGIEISEQAFVINAEPTQIKVNPEEEVEASTGLDYLAYAYIKTEHKYYDEAERLFKRALKIGGLSKPDRVAALNGLATVYYHKKQRAKCIETLNKSLAKTNQQRTPYILQFRLNNNNKKWDKAYESLYKYLQHMAEGSTVNFDTAIPLTEAHLLLGESAKNAGMQERALVHYQEYYDLKKEKSQPISDAIIEQLLNYSIQMENRKLAEQYFKHLFQRLGKDSLTGPKLEMFNRKLALFQDKGWYDFVSKKYREAYEEDKKNENIVRRLVAVYVKLGNIEAAQSILSEHKHFIS